MKTKLSTKAFELVGRRPFLEVPIKKHILSARTHKKTMSSLSRHDNIRNAGDVAPEPQTTNHPLTDVDAADATSECGGFYTDSFFGTQRV